MSSRRARSPQWTKAMKGLIRGQIWMLVAALVAVEAAPGFCQGPIAKPAPQPAVAGETKPADQAVVDVTIVEVAEPPAELVAAVTREGEATVKAFNSGDAKALGELFMEQGELIDENGTVTSGRKAITALFQAFFEKFPKASRTAT